MRLRAGYTHTVPRKELFDSGQRNDITELTKSEELVEASAELTEPVCDIPSEIVVIHEDEEVRDLPSMEISSHPAAGRHSGLPGGGMVVCSTGTT